MTIFYRIYKKILVVFILPLILREIFDEKTGQEYKVGFWDKFFLVFKIIRNNYLIKSGSGFLEHFAMISKILKIPKKTAGCIIECGSYKGGSTANLSLVCGLVKRKLVVFDSFKGLPKVSESDKNHRIVDLKKIHTYKEGAWAGSLDEVKSNISRFGDISVCEFKAGFFDKTMPGFNQKVAFVFLDVDLTASVKTCLKYLWPNLQTNSYFFTHEVHHLEISSLFFDSGWWKKNLKTSPPGLVGAGSGLGLVPTENYFKSSLGYTVKNPDFDEFEEEVQSG